MLQDPVSPLPFLASLSLACNVEVREQRLRRHAREKERERKESKYDLDSNPIIIQYFQQLYSSIAESNKWNSVSNVNVSTFGK